MAESTGITINIITNANMGFEEAARPLIKWLSENSNPHAKVIVTSIGAELLHGEKYTGEILDYIKD